MCPGSPRVYAYGTNVMLTSQLTSMNCLISCSITVQITSVQFLIKSQLLFTRRLLNKYYSLTIPNGGLESLDPTSHQFLCSSGHLNTRVQLHAYITERRQSGLKSEESWILVKKSIFSGNFTKKFRFFRQISKKFRFFQAIWLKISIFPGQFPKNSDFSDNLRKKFEFPGKNWPFTASSWQIILFLFKSHHFRTFFLYMIRYNNISRPVHDPPCNPPFNPPA